MHVVFFPPKKKSVPFVCTDHLTALHRSPESLERLLSFTGSMSHVPYFYTNVIQLFTSSSLVFWLSPTCIHLHRHVSPSARCRRSPRGPGELRQSSAVHVAGRSDAEITSIYQRWIGFSSHVQLSFKYGYWRYRIWMDLWDGPPSTKHVHQSHSRWTKKSNWRDIYHVKPHSPNFNVEQNSI